MRKFADGTRAARRRPIAQTALRQNQSPTSSFRAKRGNPLNRNVNLWGDCQKPHLFSQSLPRRESLLSKQDGQKLTPQFRKIICLVQRTSCTSGKIWTAVWARRVKQHILWMCCSQSERGGLLCKRRSPNTWGRGKFSLNKLFFYPYQQSQK